MIFLLWSGKKAALLVIWASNLVSFSNFSIFKNKGGEVGVGVMMLNSTSRLTRSSNNTLMKTKMLLNSGADLGGISIIESTNNGLKSSNMVSASNATATTSHNMNNKRSRSPLVPTINNNVVNSIELTAGNSNSNNYAKSVLSSTRIIDNNNQQQATNAIIGATTTTTSSTNKSSIGITPLIKNTATTQSIVTDQLLDMTDMELFNDENQQEALASMPKRKRLSSNPEQDAAAPSASSSASSS